MSVMSDPTPVATNPGIGALQNEVVRLNKMVTALMNRAERDMSGKGSEFGLFHTTVVLEKKSANAHRN